VMCLYTGPQAYIDFEISEGERTRTRILYQRLLDRTKHVKVRRLPGHAVPAHWCCG
jgi:hypothetical protein